VNPDSEDRVSVFMQLLESVALSIFLLVGGHRWLLDAVATSFQWMPPGKGHLPEDMPLALTEIVGQSFSISLRASAPIVLALLLATLIIGILSRTVPQINVMTLGLSINSFVVLGALALCVGTIGWTFQDAIEPAMERVIGSFVPQGLEGES
jgi:flagellar biosynthetic protein FliR